jgi:hypothetical protein
VDGAPIDTATNHFALSLASDFLMLPSGRRCRERREKQVKCLSMKKSDQSRSPFFRGFHHGNPGKLCELFFPGQEFTSNDHRELEHLDFDPYLELPER